MMFFAGYFAFPWLAFIARRASRRTAIVLGVLLLCAMLPEPLLPFFEDGNAEISVLNYYGILWAAAFPVALGVVNRRSFEGTFIFTLILCSFFPLMSILGIFLVPIVWIYVGLVAGIGWLAERSLFGRK